MKTYLLLIIGLYGFTAKGQTGIGTTSPSPSAKLEVASTNQGFLPPRIALTATNATSPVTSPATGLLVYNTATTNNASNNVAPGYYFWNGSAWVAILGNITASSISGNGTTTTLTNFGAEVNTQSGTTYTLTALDNGKIISCTSNSAVTITVPALSVGFNCLIVQRGSGQVTVSASGSTINNRYNFNKTAGQHAIMSLVSVASGQFISSGDMSN
ncbi:hypothetical protein [Flavobacterium ammonificans]|uniref:Uncharacterized protein n=1 Tax=Flavobacterium ammonificans TaxID=1751056 RepID=A0ABN6KSU4_9FLAO|nr:hypothetical protein [Flavobacterium ammonificans]BDB52205.1 hypothetical protein GENT11_05170 [Flavobacterium ammonificans]